MIFYVMKTNNYCFNIVFFVFFFGGSKEKKEGQQNYCKKDKENAPQILGNNNCIDDGFIDSLTLVVLHLQDQVLKENNSDTQSQMLESQINEIKKKN